ncbi:glycoside hydrolase family 10 protein [Jeotgalibacillus haloalkalitolerans]|uniref:Family 10 glycosylhydrolase n=1 Tax=Jeotgalibacillus haloalkalitolerans TaxID=3104292 RepID=A0ABU5KHF0_9BACL|nr:family 10 glycosylhydrolase [Jeotgalibacillus sp. HH7-29]MDZ5710678.1 family 10 glycosylhydrolase [Jeotgalibacillus sp. HH7-29]
MKESWKKLTGSVLSASLVLSSLGLAGSAVAEETVSEDVLAVMDQSGDRLEIDTTNQRSNDNRLVVFNDTFSYYTETDKGSFEVVLEKSGLTTYRVVKQTNGDSEIPENGLVLSTGDVTTDEIKGFLEQLETGETVTLHEPTVKQENMQSNAVDPTAQSNPGGAVFDGFRGPDQLIVYTPGFGSSTKTNQYGYEITVEDGFVTKLGGGNSAIPENGFVVSGHGVGSAWLSSNSIIGAKVTVNENGVVEITQDVESFQYQSRQSIEQAKNSIEKAKAEFLDVAMEEAEESVEKAEALLEDASQMNAEDPVRALHMTREATQIAYDAYYYSLPSNIAEQRGIWYRPEETTLEGVNQVLDRMEEAGFNSVYLETTFWGYTIYPSETMKAYGLPEQHPNFKNGDYGEYGKDLLKAYIEEGKKRGMTVQAWTDGFMIGHGSLGLPSQFQKYPEWAAIQRSNTTGKPAPDSSNQYYWLDIVQPDVQEFMLAIYEEMQSEYDIKGLNIDYMRYPHHGFDKSYGYSTEAREMYKEVSGIDPLDLTAADQDEWDAWQEWIRTKENEFVSKLHDQSKAIDKRFMLTATPEPGPEAVLIGDWKDDIDGVIPQAYGHDFNSIQNTVNASKKLMPEGTMYYTGIYSFYHHLSEMASVNDVMSAKYGTSGVNMFAFGQASAPSVDALGKGPWREKAINPGEEPIEASFAVLKDMQKQIGQNYIAGGAVKGKDAASIRKAVKNVEKSIQRDTFNTDEAYQNAQAIITELIETEKLNKALGERMLGQLEETKLWVNYSNQHHQ